MVVEASGSSQGITLASAMTRPMGTLILKTTCSTVNDPQMPKWSDLANDIVVNEKRLLGSRSIFLSDIPAIVQGLVPMVNAKDS